MNQVTEEISAIWVCGFSSAGKTTLSRLIVRQLMNHGYPAMLIDGNETRDLFENKYGFDPDSRRRQTIRIKKMTRWVLKQKIIPVVAIIHPFEDDRVSCRQEIPGYFEIFLDCNLDECIKRDQKNVYQPVIDGIKKDVVGLDIPYDPHQQADIVMRSDQHSPEDLLAKLWTRIEARLVDNRLGNIDQIPLKDCVSL